MIVPFLLTLISALLYVLSFPPFSLSLLAWVALVPFFLVCSMVQPRSAAVYGLLWGVVMTCGFGWCFAEMVASYFRVSFAAGWMALFAVSLLLFGLYFGVFAMWLSWMVRRQAASPFLVAAGWGLCEFARANFIIGNPLALAGYSQVEYSRLMQIADATGPYGVGVLIAAVNASLAGLFSLRLRGYHPLVSLPGVLVALGMTLGYGEWRLSQTFATGTPVTVAVVQGAIERPFRWNPEHRTANLARYLTLTRETSLAHPQLIFWPENAVDFYLQEEAPEREAVLSVTRDLNAALILGGPYYGYGIADLYYHNSVFLIRRGKIAGRYDKIHLLPFAERTQFGRGISLARITYAPGRRFHSLRVEDVRVGTFVCFEAMYPELVRNFVTQGADILANPANDDWFGHAAPARLMLDMATVRAIENRRYLVRPTTTGFSAVIDPYGRTLVRSGFGTPAVLTATVYPSQAQTLYQRWGDVAIWIALSYTTAVSLCCALRGEKNETGGP